MPETGDHLAGVGRVVQALEALGLAPILVGGMALVILGSRRVTRDFDFVIPHPGPRLEEAVDALYDLGLELAARVDTSGDITATIANRRVAAARLRIDKPGTAYFLQPSTGLRIDLLFDFPIPAATLARRARSHTIRSVGLRIASDADLLRLKQIARERRSAPGDLEDTAFLEARLRKRRRREPDDQRQS
jgi:hypothetical protein